MRLRIGELRPKYTPECANSHDFPDKEKGKAAPYGVYDLAENETWVSVGINHDTAEFSIATIRTWYQKPGYALYPTPTSLLIIADAGGSNGYRLRLWKVELQQLANVHLVPRVNGTTPSILRCCGQSPDRSTPIY